MACYEEFWETIPEGWRDLEIFSEIIPTGSRLFGVYHPLSDWDIACWGPNAMLLGLEMVVVGGWKCGFEYKESKWVSLRKGKINAIVFSDRDCFERYKLATEFCVKTGGPWRKKKRVRIFEQFQKPA